MIQVIAVIAAFSVGFFFGGAAQYQIGREVNYPAAFIVSAAIGLLGTAAIFVSAVLR